MYYRDNGSGDRRRPRSILAATTDIGPRAGTKLYSGVARGRTARGGKKGKGTV